MEAFPFDERDSDAVFGAPGADVPDSLLDVSDLVQAARRAGSADELVGGDELVAGVAAVIRAAAIGEHAAPLPSVADERIRVFNKFRTAKVAAAATAVLMLGGTAAAAATGALPAPVVRHHAALTSAELSTGPTGATGATGGEGHHGHHHGLSGTVASVNGSTDPSACGSGDTGTFTLTGHHGETFTVNVAPATKYWSKHVTDASFANVCIGSRVKVKGMVDGTTVAADKVRIKGPKSADHHEHERRGAFGTVASVNGSTDPAACGTGDTGTFTLTDQLGNTFTVNVDPATTFAQSDAATPTFANICVGGLAFAKGAVTDTTVAATKVFILPPKPDPPVHEQHEGVFGAVVSVNGSTDPAACGSGDTGSFTVTDRDGNTFTVNVTPDTNFLGKHHDDSSGSFADVCVGNKVGAKGDVTDTTITAEKVFVLGDHDGEHHHGRHHHHDGDNDGDNDGDHDGEHHDGSFAEKTSFHSGSQDSGSQRADCDHNGGTSGSSGWGGNDSGHES